MQNNIEPAEKNNKLKYLLIGVIFILLSTNGIMIYFYINNTNEIIDKKKELKFTTKQLYEAQARIDSMSIEIKMRIEAFEALEKENKLMAEDQKGLEELRAALKRMTSLKNNFQHDAGKAWRLYNDNREKIEGFKELLQAKDVELKLLRKENTYLQTENQTLKVHKATTENKIDSMRFIEEELKEKVMVASALEATNIKVSYVNTSQKEKDKQPFKASKIARLKISFNLPVNKVAEVETKAVFLKVIDPDGDLVLDQSAGAKTFSGDGKAFTTKQMVLYSRDNQLVDLYFSKGGNYKPGKYDMELYCEGNTIGKSSFEIK